jgi:sulfite reductase alpha subunit-like flavoprotein
MPQVYVQHRLREHGEKVAQLILEQNAFFFVCGCARLADCSDCFWFQLIIVPFVVCRDGRSMVSQVQKAVEEILAKHGRMSKKVLSPATLSRS